MGQSGLDAVVVDMQHGMTDLQSLPAMLTALATTAATPFVRLASGAPAEIMKALDAGAYGLNLPPRKHGRTGQSIGGFSLVPTTRWPQLWAFSCKVLCR